VRPPGLALRAYGLLARGLGALAPYHLRRRLARGREDATRWREKLGQAGQMRPPGRLVWLHGVGLGEVMALRGVIEAMSRADPALQFLVTSSARSSALVMGANLPARTVHQYLPLDAPQFVARFLDHWQPFLSVWSDQDLWPCAVLEADRRGIPLVFLNARITAESLEKRKYIQYLYADVLERFQFVMAQDKRSADHLASLGAGAVQVSPSIKASAPVLRADGAELDRMQTMFKGRKVWVAASTHPEDEAVAIAAQAQLFAADPRWLLLLVPRLPNRHLALDIAYVQRSKGEGLAGEPVYLADTLGELGLWYRLAGAALMGGSFGPVQGHNPWEAAALGCAVLHGPHVENFANDYRLLHDENAAIKVPNSVFLANRLAAGGLDPFGQRGRALTQNVTALDALAQRLVGLAR